MSLNKYLNMYSQSIPFKLIDNSFNLNQENYSSRKNYFDKNIFSKLCINAENNDIDFFVYDILVISKLYSIIFYLYKVNFKNDYITLRNFIKNVQINLETAENAENDLDIDNNKIIIYNLFDISNLKLEKADNIDEDKYYTIYNIKNFSNDKLFEAIERNILIPLYHHFNKEDNTSYGLSKNIDINNKKIDISTITKDSITTLYDDNKVTIETDLNNYTNTRILLYLNAFNNILNATDENILSVLKYHMYYYNAIIYNIKL